MTLITEFTVPASTFALEDTFADHPEATVEVERLATHSREWVMPFLWVSVEDSTPVAVESALEDDSSVHELRTLDRTDSIAYYNVRWAEPVQALIDQIVNRHGIVHEASATHGIWSLTLQFVNQDALEGFQTFFSDRGDEFELQRLYDGTAPRERAYDLTASQREALVRALELGYFEVPRASTIEELAADLDLSTNAVSQRLRRGTRNLTRNTLTVSADHSSTDST